MGAVLNPGWCPQATSTSERVVDRQLDGEVVVDTVVHSRHLCSRSNGGHTEHICSCGHTWGTK